jgi:hypothetical protein
LLFTFFLFVFKSLSTALFSWLFNDARQDVYKRRVLIRWRLPVTLPPLSFSAGLSGFQNDRFPINLVSLLLPVVRQHMGVRNFVSPWSRFCPVVPAISSRVFPLSFFSAC